jgi:acetoin utilization deacetylase AcuC-like enzyme
VRLVTRRDLPIFYSPEYVAAAHAFDTTRKASNIAASLQNDPIAGVRVVAPRPLEELEIARVHDAAYVRAVRLGQPRALAESQGFAWDAGLWTAVRWSSGGVVAAARAALESGDIAGSLSSGLHHARRERGEGSCTFNGLALAADAALAAGARAVLVLDFDAHCGGGTHALLGARPGVWHVDISVSDYDAYEPGPRGSLTVISDAATYLPTIAARLEQCAAAGVKFDLCLYNAGMDPCEDSAEDGLPGVTFAMLAAREAMVFDWCRSRGIPVAFVLAGGYISERLDERGLVALHRLTISAAASG